MTARTSQRDVVVVGSVNIDVSMDVVRHPKPGETVSGNGLVLTPGGKGANQAVAAARLGARVTMIGATGDDANAALATSQLIASGVNLDGLMTFPGPTGTAYIFVDAHGENSIVILAGANGKVSAEAVQVAAKTFTAESVVLLQGEIPVCAISATAALCQGQLVLNLAPMVELPRDVIERADLLVVNEHEARALAEQLAPDHDCFGASPSKLATVLLAQGVRSLVITLGARGSLIASSSVMAAVPSAPVSVVDSTGAGDAFVGAMVAELAKGAELMDAVRFGSRVGAFACTRRGAQTSFPTVEDELPVLRGS